jgi:hypothetical protein
MVAVRDGADECIPEEAPNNVLEEPHSLLFNQLVHHIAQNGAHGVEALISLADIAQPDVIQQNLLDDEDSNSLAELRSSLHDAETEGDDFGGEKEVDDLGGVILHQGADHAERGQAQIFKRSRFRGGVEERVQEERNMC